MNPLNTSFVHSTQIPSPCSDGDTESGKIPTTRQPIRSHNFPGASFPLSTVFSFSSAPIAYHKAALPPLPPRKAHKRANSVRVSDFNSLMSQSAMRSIYPKPMEMPVGVNESKEGPREEESHGEEPHFMDEIFNAYKALDGIFDGKSSGSMNATSGVKRRACIEIAPSSRIDKPSIGGDENVFRDANGRVVSDPKKIKRILANREAGARSKERKANYKYMLESKVDAFQTENAKRCEILMLLKSDKFLLEEDNKRLRLQIQGMEEKAKIGDALTELLHREVHRLTMVTKNVICNRNDRSNEQSYGSNIFQQLNQVHQQPQTNQSMDEMFLSN